MPGTHQIDLARLIWGVGGAMPAVVEDLWRGRISNWVCGILIAGALILGVVDRGAAGFALGLAGATAGAFMFLIFYLLGGMGGGDIKLMAAFGALVGLKEVLTAAIITVLAGSFIALGTIAVAACRKRRVESIPYAPAIAIGALTTLLSRLGAGN